MSETPFENSQNSDDELLAQYQFDYQKAKPNRFANRSGMQGLTVMAFDQQTKLLQSIVGYILEVISSVFSV